MKKSALKNNALSIASFGIFVSGLYFFGDIELFIAAGFAVLLLIHELGHIYAIKKLRIKTKGVYFVPFIGAITAVEDKINTENDYAYFKYCGPLFGTAGTLAMFGLYRALNDNRFLVLAFSGAIFNLINLIPITFLDGYAMLRKSVKFIRWIGLLILAGVGIFMPEMRMLALLLLVVFMLFSEGVEATGYQTHEIIIAGLSIGVMIISMVVKNNYSVWNISYILLALFLLGSYIKVTQFDHSQGKGNEYEERILSPLTRRQQILWPIRWVMLVSILVLVGYLGYLEYI